MTSKKRSAESYVSDGGFVEDDASSNDDHRAKKSKNDNAASSRTLSKSQNVKGSRKDDNGDPYWELNASDTRRVTVNTFSGKSMVNIREYYEKDGKKLPGKKGISLTMEQYVALLKVLPQVESALEQKGERVPRPQYDASTQPIDSEDEEADDGGKVGKQNFEATSDEDE